MLRLFLRDQFISVRGGLRFLKYNRIFQKYRSFTVIGRAPYFTNLALVERFRRVPGVIVECGVWRGGMSAGIAEIVGMERQYYLFDNFEGMPPPQQIDGKKAQAWVKWQTNPASPYNFGNYVTDDTYADQAMKLSGAKHYQIVKGWFDQTLPAFQPDVPIAVLRLDAGWYEATLTCLKGLYPYLIVGGIIILDDYYGWEGAAKALHDFLSQEKLSDRVHQFNNRLCFVVKMDTQQTGT